MNSRAGPNYGKSLQAVAQTENTDVCEALGAKVDFLFGSSTYKPPLLPAVALELLELSRKPNVSVKAVGALLSHDPVLAAQLLRIVQSPIYSAGGPVRSLDEAILRLGLTRVSDLFLRASLEMRVFRAPGYDRPMEQLRKHAAFTAEMSRLVCRRTLGFDDYAYLCGLLHDVGIAAAAIVAAELGRGDTRPSFDQVWACLRRNHATYGQNVARLWGLPPDVCTIIELHHSLRLGTHVHPVAAVVSLADGLSSEVLMGFEDETDAATIDFAATSLGLSEGALKSLRLAAAQLAGELLT
jgi:putative nucleotidyltransferase with HDIG domain